MLRVRVGDLWVFSRGLPNSSSSGLIRFSRIGHEKRSVPPELGQHRMYTSPSRNKHSVKASLDSNPARLDNSTPSTAWNQSPPMTRGNESLWNLGPGMKSGLDSSLSCRTRPNWDCSVGWAGTKRKEGAATAKTYSTHRTEALPTN